MNRKDICKERFQGCCNICFENWVNPEDIRKQHDALQAMRELLAASKAKAAEA